jgi:hypothetical protein
MGSAGRTDRLREAAFEYAFLLRALNVEKGPQVLFLKPVPLRFALGT